MTSPKWPCEALMRSWAGHSTLLDWGMTRITRNLSRVDSIYFYPFWGLKSDAVGALENCTGWSVAAHTNAGVYHSQSDGPAPTAWPALCVWLKHVLQHLHTGNLVGSPTAMNVLYLKSPYN